MGVAEMFMHVDKTRHDRLVADVELEHVPARASLSGCCDLGDLAVPDHDVDRSVALTSLISGDALAGERERDP